MDFMKVLDQAVREIKREVNLRVLQVPEMEQKVLDATDNEPWGPHGSALADIAQATKKFTESQTVMNALWTRLGETGKNWRRVYKALTVIEYLVAHGSELAVDDIVEHSFQISSLSTFEYSEPSGKDVGINVRKKAGTVAALLNDKDKIQQVRNKAAENRDKYFGLSSTGITYKSASASYSSSSFQSGDRHRGSNDLQEGDGLGDNYHNRGHTRKVKIENDIIHGKSSEAGDDDNQWKTSKGSSRLHSKDQKNNMTLSVPLKPYVKSNDCEKNDFVCPQKSSAPSSYFHADFDDDFDPRGISFSKPADETHKQQLDLFQQESVTNLMDAPPIAPIEPASASANFSEADDLFADAPFVSAQMQPQLDAASCSQPKVDSQPEHVNPSAVPPPMDFFNTTDDQIEQPEAQTARFATENADPFLGSDVFAALAEKDDARINNLSEKSLPGCSGSRKETLLVKSGIWADSLSRGLIDLNLSAPKKTSMAESAASFNATTIDEQNQGLQASHVLSMAMRKTMSLGRSDASFFYLSNQHH